MTSDLDLEQRQQDFEDEQREQMAREAAALVVDGTDRASAVEMVKSIYREQAGATENELIRDDEGFPEYLLPEAQQPVLPTDPKKLAQVKAIAQDLIHHFE